VSGWSLAPGAIKVQENFNRAQAGDLHAIQSDKDGIVKYMIQGASDETDPFELELSGNLNGGNPIATLWLKTSWRDTNGDIATSLDRESKSTYKLMVSALDSRDNELEKSMLTVKVTDQNDEKPVFTQASRNLRCAENVAHNTVCGTIRADDKDEQGLVGYGDVEYKIPPADEKWFTVSGQMEIKRTGMFAVDGKSGDVKLMNPDRNMWDREKYEKVMIKVQAVDSPNMPTVQHTVDAEITIEILDENDEQARFESSCGQLSVDENQITELYLNGAGFTFKGVDADATEDNNLVFFELVNADNEASFHITSPGKKNEATMSTRVPLDYETKNKYQLQIRAFNKNAAKQSSSMEETCEITVIVNDVNEPPVWEDAIPEFVEGNGEGSRSQNGINPHAVDLDVEFPSEVTYKIIDDPERYFNINADTGALTVITLLADGIDRECAHCEDGKYTVTLEACDEQNLCSEYAQQIKIRDVNDQAPMFDNFPTSVCQAPDDLILIDNLKALDRDDCTLPGHCGKMEMLFSSSGYRNLFHLEQLSDSDYRLKLAEGKQLDSMEYQLEFTGIERDNNNRELNRIEKLYTIKACSCSAGEKTPSKCKGGLTTGSVNRVAEYLSIFIAIVALMVFIILLIVYKKKRANDGSKEGLLDDLDDERATVMVYSTEGGGEEDQTNYNTATLMKARPVTKEKPIKPMKNGFANSIPPEDIGQYISAAKDHADQDVHAAPYDSLLTFDYEGNNSLVGDLSETSSVLDMGEFDHDHNIASWGPKFRKLAELYSGRENDAFEP